MKAQKINDNSRKPFNNAPLRDGEVLVPQLVNDRDYAIAIGAKPENFRTWSKGGVQYTVMFVPVPSEQEKNCQQAFDEAVNQYLDEKIGPNRHSRCMVPQPDGTYKPCPKIKNSNHVPCGSCQHRGEYKREDKSTVSLEVLDEKNFHPMEAAPSAESVSMEKLLFNDLLDYLREKNPLLADVASLGFHGFSKSEVIQRLPLKKTQAYSIYDEAEKLSREFLLK